MPNRRVSKNIGHRARLRNRKTIEQAVCDLGVDPIESVMKSLNKLMTDLGFIGTKPMFTERLNDFYEKHNIKVVSQIHDELILSMPRPADYIQMDFIVEHSRVRK